MNNEFNNLISNSLEKRKTTQEWVTDILRESILNGYFKDGEPIPTASLTEKLGVSRMPIRIALMQLESEGLVSMEPHKPAAAVKLSPKEVQQIYEIRCELEGLAIELAVERINNNDIHELVSILEKMKTTKDSEVYMNLNNEFHNKINVASDNEVLINIINQLRNKIQKYVRLYLSSNVNIDKASKEHNEIMDAILIKDGMKARNAVKNHLATTCSAVTKKLSEALKN